MIKSNIVHLSASVPWMPLNAKGIHGMARQSLPRSYMEYRVVVSGVVDKLTMSKIQRYKNEHKEN